MNSFLFGVVFASVMWIKFFIRCEDTCHVGGFGKIFLFLRICFVMNDLFLSLLIRDILPLNSSRFSRDLLSRVFRPLLRVVRVLWRLQRSINSPHWHNRINNSLKIASEERAINISMAFGYPRKSFSRCVIESVSQQNSAENPVFVLNIAAYNASCGSTS